MKRVLRIFVPIIVAFAAGCRHNPEIPFAPYTPVAAEEVPVDQPSPEEVRRELEQLQDAPEPPYLISANDRFDFRVYDNDDLNVNGLEVTPDGYVSIGLVGPVKIGGLTMIQASALLEEELKKFIRFPRISLIPTRVRSSTFTISGKVVNPGIYPISGNMRITDAIAIAQGFATGVYHSNTVEMADLKNAYIARDGKILPVDFASAIRGGDHLNNIPLRHGDYIYIPSSMNLSVYVLGEVVRPSYVGFKDNLTLVQAIAYAQGLKETNAEDVLIIRGNLAKPKIYRVNIDRVLMGKGLDFPLQPNDVVFVPRGGLSEYNLVVRKLLPTLQALSLMAGPFSNAAVAVGN